MCLCKWRWNRQGHQHLHTGEWWFVFGNLSDALTPIRLHFFPVFLRILLTNLSHVFFKVCILGLSTCVFRGYVVLHSTTYSTCSQYLFQSLLMMNSELVLCRIRSQLGQLKFCRRDKFVTCLWTNMGFCFFVFHGKFLIEIKTKLQCLGVYLEKLNHNKKPAGQNQS